MYLFISEIIPFLIWGLYDSFGLCELYYNFSFTVKQEISLIDRIQSEKEHKYNSADTDILLKTWGKIQSFFIVKKFEWLVKACTKLEDFIPKFLLNCTFQEWKESVWGKYYEHEVLKIIPLHFKFSAVVNSDVVYKIKRPMFDLALDFSPPLSDFSCISLNQ